MSHFYITLPSDSSMSFFPNNTVAEFTTKLPDRIFLDGDYEVALSELIYPHSFSNIRNDDRSLYIEVRRSNDGSLESRYMLDGQQHGIKPLSSSFAKGQYITSFMSLFSGTGKANVMASIDQNLPMVMPYTHLI